MRLAKKMLNVSGIAKQFESEKKFVNKMFKDSDTVNPYPVCEQFFFEKKCEFKENCIRLHVF